METFVRAKPKAAEGCRFQRAPTARAGEIEPHRPRRQAAEARISSSAAVTAGMSAMPSTLRSLPCDA